MMKETGRAPKGRILLVGNGPLLVAVAAQMAKLGNPPIAVVETGDPLAQISAGLGLLRSPGLMFEALNYLRQMIASGVPWLRAAVLTGIAQTENGLLATVRDKAGKRQVFRVDRIGLHDGIRPNDFGLPKPSGEIAGKPLIAHAGDCREALGAGAAEADGRRAARKIIAALSAGHTESFDTIERHRREQALLSRIFAPVHKPTPLSTLPDETILCRCEQATVGGLKALCDRSDLLTGREVKHNGRFAMGACQGRFCADNTAALMAELKPIGPAPQAQDLTGSRWPIRPVSIAALIRAEDGDETLSQVGLPDNKELK
jgi:D-hydroxyproline dehydrogenase subunit alpha